MRITMFRWTAAYIHVLLALLFVLLTVQDGAACNEAVCGSIVSKCLLTQSCKCDFQKDCSCCKECAFCLSSLYSECCSCVDMCPKPNATSSNELSKQSHVEDFEAIFADLFHALTETPDSLNRWSIYNIKFNDITLKNDIKYHLQSAEQDVTPTKGNMTKFSNCTVAYWAQCMSWEKCKESCQQMGASSMRWFHDGCCECVGQNCFNYGSNESRCANCSKLEELGDDLVDEDDKDYGEDDYDEDEIEDNR